MKVLYDGILTILLLIILIVLAPVIVVAIIVAAICDRVHPRAGAMSPPLPIRGIVDLGQERAKRRHPSHR